LGVRIYLHQNQKNLFKIKTKILKTKIKFQGREIKCDKNYVFYCPVNGGSSKYIDCYLHLFILRMKKKGQIFAGGEKFVQLYLARNIWGNDICEGEKGQILGETEGKLFVSPILF